VFKVTDRGFDRDAAGTELTEVLDQAVGKGVVTRGAYDVQGLHADADYMLWRVASASDDLQETYAWKSFALSRLRSTALSGRVHGDAPLSAPEGAGSVAGEVAARPEPPVLKWCLFLFRVSARLS
jgi:chlorite dismutase